jgi:hypothetical protein
VAPYLTVSRLQLLRGGEKTGVIVPDTESQHPWASNAACFLQDSNIFSPEIHLPPPWGTIYMII